MKQTYFTTLLIISLFFTNSVHTMEAEKTSWVLQLPGEVINHIIGDCQPEEKDNLMKVCKPLHTCFQDKEAILLANPVTIKLSYKINKTFQYTRSGDARKLSIWLSVLWPIDVDEIDKKYDWPLCIASVHGYIDIMQMLINAGADVNKSVNGWTALYAASAYGKIEVARLLLGTHGIDVDKDPVGNGQTALHIAVINNHVEIVQLLLKSGANVNNADIEDRTPLYFASSMGYIDIVQVLLAANEINVNFTDDWGRTALHIALEQGNTNIVRLLIGRIDIDNNNGNKALQIAQKKGHADIENLIKDYLLMKQLIKTYYPSTYHTLQRKKID